MPCFEYRNTPWADSSRRARIAIRLLRGLTWRTNEAINVGGMFAPRRHGQISVPPIKEDRFVHSLVPSFESCFYGMRLAEFDLS